jgi:hypothetical protein
MLSCWKLDPNDRPTFTEICKSLSEMLEGTNLLYNYVDAVRCVEIEIVSDSEDGEVNV